MLKNQWVVECDYCQLEMVSETEDLMTREPIIEALREAGWHVGLTTLCRDCADNSDIVQVVEYKNV